MHARKQPAERMIQHLMKGGKASAHGVCIGDQLYLIPFYKTIPL